jgi:hypothetical protein
MVPLADMAVQVYFITDDDAHADATEVPSSCNGLTALMTTLLGPYILATGRLESLDTVTVIDLEAVYPRKFVRVTDTENVVSHNKDLGTRMKFADLSYRVLR